MKNYNFCNIRVVFVRKAESRTDYSRIHLFYCLATLYTFVFLCNSTTAYMHSTYFSSIIDLLMCCTNVYLFCSHKEKNIMSSDVDWLGGMYIYHEIPERKQKLLPLPPCQYEKIQEPKQVDTTHIILLKLETRFN